MAIGDPITVIVAGEPVPFARMRIGNRGHHFVPSAQRNFAAAVQIEAANTMRELQTTMFDEAVTLELLAELPIPQSWSKKKQHRALVGQLRPTGRPDLDNLYKLVADAFNQIVFRDDSQVVSLRLRKRYGNEPKLVVTVKAVNGEIG
jgi:Holliday junction resolvase RusA-like endonuclease